jgi:hypothetical protein
LGIKSKKSTSVSRDRSKERSSAVEGTLSQEKKRLLTKPEATGAQLHMDALDYHRI